MVGPGDVDEDLQPEVAEECAKYGEVERCLIFEVMDRLFFVSVHELVHLMYIVILCSTNKTY